MLDALPLSALPASAEALRPAVRAFLDEALAGRPTDRLARSWMGMAWKSHGPSEKDKFTLVRDYLMNSISW